MKKFFIFFLLILICLPFNVFAMADNATSAIIIETSTGKVVFEKEADQELAPASMTKIMTLLLVMEAIDSGKLSMDEEIIISENAAGMGGSQVFLEAFSKMKVNELIKSVAIASANDAAVALAERIGGTTDKFVEMMNNKAQELGLNHTHFVNVHGLDAEEHYSSARDMAIMALELIKHEDILSYTSVYEDYLMKPDGTSTWLVNTNKLVRYYDGVDGLKTGYTENAKYCLTSTAKKNNLRFITVVMGEPTSEIRSKETTEMLNYSFNSYKLNTILTKDYIFGKINVDKGMKSSVEVILKDDVTELMSVEDEVQEYTYNVLVDNVKAPVKIGDVIGTVEILDSNNTVVKTGELTVNENIDKATFFHTLKCNLKEIIAGKNIEY